MGKFKALAVLVMVMGVSIMALIRGLVLFSIIMAGVCVAWGANLLLFRGKNVGKR